MNRCNVAVALEKQTQNPSRKSNTRQQISPSRCFVIAGTFKSKFRYRAPPTPTNVTDPRSDHHPNNNNLKKKMFHGNVYDAKQKDDAANLTSEVAKLRAAVKAQGEQVTSLVTQLTKQSRKVRALEEATRSGSARARSTSSTSDDEHPEEIVARANLAMRTNSSTLCRYHNKRQSPTSV